MESYATACPDCQALSVTVPLLDRDGTFAAHRHFTDCLRENRQPLTDVRDVIATMRLLEQIESPFWLDPASSAKTADPA
jgi:hypothetical protein